MDSEWSAFNIWSLLSLTATAHGVLAYPDELGVRSPTRPGNNWLDMIRRLHYQLGK